MHVLELGSSFEGHALNKHAFEVLLFQKSIRGSFSHSLKVLDEVKNIYSKGNGAKNLQVNSKGEQSMKSVFKIAGSLQKVWRAHRARFSGEALLTLLTRNLIEI